jgi:hypothetical protein
MGNEDPWFLIVGGAFALLVLAAVVFIPLKIVQLLVGQRRIDRHD